MAMIYENPDYRKVKNSFLLIVSCAHCKNEIALYQKVGRGGLLRMYVERIVKSSVDLSKKPRGLFCPNCGEQLGARVTLRRKKSDAYRMIRSAFNTKTVDNY